MKKLIIGTVISMFSIFSASAEVGINVGISGSAGAFYASATEVDTGTHGTTTDTNETRDDNDVLGLGWSSVFVEKTIGDRFAIGLELVPDALASETDETVRMDKTTNDTQTAKTNKVQVDFEDLTTLYVVFNVMENAYIRAGMMTVDVETNETLATGSSYGNTDLDGTVFGIGWNKSLDNGIFFRAEGNYMEFDGASLTSSSGSQKITLDNLEGVSGKLSVGKSF